MSLSKTLKAKPGYQLHQAIHGFIAVNPDTSIHDVIKGLKPLADKLGLTVSTIKGYVSEQKLAGLLNATKQPGLDTFFSIRQPFSYAKIQNHRTTSRQGSTPTFVPVKTKVLKPASLAHQLGALRNEHGDLAFFREVTAMRDMWFNGK